MTSSKVLNEEDLREQCRNLRRRGRPTVFTNGCFDLLHPGHVSYLEAARGLGDALIVAVNSDRSVRALKGRGRPIAPEQDRARMLAALACVDYVTVFNDDTAARLLALLRPDTYVKGGDYAQNAPVEAPVVHAYGGRVHILPFAAGYSTSDLVDRIKSHDHIQ